MTKMWPSLEGVGRNLLASVASFVTRKNVSGPEPRQWQVESTQLVVRTQTERGKRTV